MYLCPYLLHQPRPRPYFPLQGRCYPSSCPPPPAPRCPPDQTQTHPISPYRTCHSSHQHQYPTLHWHGSSCRRGDDRVYQMHHRAMHPGPEALTTSQYPRHHPLPPPNAEPKNRGAAVPPREHPPATAPARAVRRPPQAVSPALAHSASLSPAAPQAPPSASARPPLVVPAAR